MNQNNFNQVKSYQSFNKNEVKNVQPNQSTYEFSNKRKGALICESVFYLNKSNSKWISVGLSLERNYKPVIKLGGNKNQHAIFNEDQWISFLNNQGIMMSFIYATNNNFGWDPMLGSGYEIHFVFINNSRIIRIIQDGGNEVFLAGETLTEVVNLTNLIKYRFDLLKSQDFSNYYNIIISGISVKQDNIIKRIYDVISPSKNINSINIACILELLQFYSDCIIEDIELFACNEFIKSCIEK
jgi:hypothetical protein